jgi:hypothetical protein
MVGKGAAHWHEENLQRRKFNSEIADFDHCKCNLNGEKFAVMNINTLKLTCKTMVYYNKPYILPTSRVLIRFVILTINRINERSF